MHLLPLLLLLPLSFSFSSADPSLLRSIADGFLDNFEPRMPLEINLLRPQTSFMGTTVKPKVEDEDEVVSWSSWRLAVETNNLRGWTVPPVLKSYIHPYIHGEIYWNDFTLVIREAIRYLRELNHPGDGSEIWVFDIDETTLSNFFAPRVFEHGSGVKPFNRTELPALRQSLKLYREVLSLGIKPVFLSGRPEQFRNFTAANLKKVGYHSWEKLILRGEEVEVEGTVQQYKLKQRRQLIEEGYKIVGNIGDQWADVVGSPHGERTFKVPNPVYYIS